MHQHNTVVSQQKWYDSAHACLCVLGTYLRQIGFFEPLQSRIHIKQKVLKYTPIQKLEMLFVGLLAGIKAVSHTARRCAWIWRFQRHLDCQAVPINQSLPIP